MAFDWKKRRNQMYRKLLDDDCFSYYSMLCRSKRKALPVWHCDRFYSVQRSLQFLIEKIESDDDSRFKKYSPRTSGR